MTGIWCRCNFAPYARYLADRAKALKPSSVLETAAGTGVLTHMLVQTLTDEVEITATDLNQPMINRARAKSGTTKVTWQQADALQLPFASESFDLVICQFDVMFFPDKEASFREAARVLRLGGKYLFAVWDDWEEMPDAPLAIAADVVAAMLGCDPSRLLSLPYHDEHTLQQDLEMAQFRQIEVERLKCPSTAPSASEAAFAAVHGSLIRTVIQTEDPGLLDEATNAVERALEAKFGKGIVSGWTRALIVTAERGR